MRDKKEKKKNITLETVGFMLRLAAKERPLILVLFAIISLKMVVYSMVDVIAPKFIVDEAVAIIGGGGAEHIRKAVYFALGYVLLQVLLNIINNFCHCRASAEQQWLSEYIEVKIGSHAMAMDFEHTENPDALDALEKAKEGMSWYSGGVGGIVNSFMIVVQEAAVLCGAAAVIITVCPWLLPVQFIVLAIIGILTAKNNAIEKKTFMQLAKSNRIWGYLLIYLSDFKLGKDIRLYESADMMCQKAAYFGNEVSMEWIGKDGRQFKNQRLMDIANALRDGIGYFYIGLLALRKTITIGDFSMAISGSSTFFWSLKNIVEGIQSLSMKCAYAHRYIEFLEYPAAMEKGDKAVDKNGKHEIEFVNVSFKYPRSEKYILENLNIKISSGEHLSIVGLNGAGKTTFIKLLCRLYDVTEGEIRIDGVNIKEYSEDEYRRLFAVVFQDFKLFAFSLRENIALADEANGADGADAAVSGHIEEVLRQSGLYEDAMKLEHGLDTNLFKTFDEKGTELSGGQQQKVAISRALYRNAPIVILDEPTAALDPVAEYDIYRSFDSLVGGKTAIYISHRLSSCKFCDRIAVFSEGTIKEYGTHEELAALPMGIYAQMFGEQAKYYVDEAV
ncbi:MAG: ABC transporter ATP-binding protein/permease [Oscillospiraceae bacterium]|nr:ABC transporter ATP-binding protein/permease [Oscillospiraceae bacterium]